MNKVSGLIICRDEEKNIEECLKSIQWCDEIIVIDSYSKDSTLEIVKKYTDKVFQNEWNGFSEQRKFALTKVNSEWVYSLDADERCTNDLANEIRNVLVNCDSINGFLIPRKSFFLGKWIRHCGWYPDLQMRLFRSDKVTVSDRLVHEGYKIDGKTAVLKNDIFHYTVRSISEFTEKINHYSTLSAIEKADSKNISMSYLFFKPFFEFKKKFFFQQGFRDGIHGLMVSFFHMITKILTYMKMREIQINKDRDK